MRLDCSREPYELQFLPLRVREKEAINNVCRLRENMVAYADGSQLVVYNRVTQTEWCSVWLESQIRAIKVIEEVDIPEDPQMYELR